MIHSFVVPHQLNVFLLVVTILSKVRWLPVLAKSAKAIDMVCKLKETK